MTPECSPRGDETSAAIASGWSRGMRSGPLAPVQAATAVEQAFRVTSPGLAPLPPLIPLRCAPRGRPTDSVTFPGRPAGQSSDLLAEIDPSQFKVALAQAQANWQKIKPRLPTPAVTWRVITTGKNQSRISSGAGCPTGAVSETEGTIKADEASVASAQLNSTGAASPHQSMVALVSSRLCW